MTDLRQAATLALKALDKLSKLGNGNQNGNSLGNTIAQEAREHLFTALAQPEQRQTFFCVTCNQNRTQGCFAPNCRPHWRETA